MQHDHMQAMALYPFAAIDQPPKRAELSPNRDAKGVLHGMDCAHLIGDGQIPQIRATMSGISS